MTFGISGAALLGAGATVVGSVISGNAAKDAAQTQANAAAAADAQHRADLKPWTDAGTTALGQLTAGTAPDGQFAKPFTMADATNSPAEQFAMQQGIQALQNSAAAKGGLIGTNENQDLMKFGAGVASQYEGQAFNQWLQGNQQRLNALQSIAGLGQSSAMNVADSSANLTLAGANAKAAGTVGSANALGSGISSLGNQLTTLSQLFNNTSSNPGMAVDPNSMGIDPYNQLGGAGTAGDYSDERLKTNIKRVGYTDEGVPIYTYRMKDGGPFKMGVMAQELEKTNPRAVTRDVNSLMMVDYRRVG